MLLIRFGKQSVFIATLKRDVYIHCGKKCWVFDAKQMIV